MNTKKPRKQNNSHGVNIAREFMRKELTGEYTLTDSAGNYLAPTDIVALWDDSTIAKKFDIGISSVLYLRRELKIPNAYERRKAVFAKLRQSPNGENCQTVQKSPVETEEPKNTLPAWCKVGQWVMMKDGDIGEITGVNGKYLSILEPGDEDWFGIIYSAVKPIRFRAYTFGEAKGLIGNTLEIPERDGFCGIDLICSVSYDRENDEVFINAEGFKSHSEDGCLIDGHPIGVPEVDESVMEGGAE
jgi:hypothetical protein